LFNNDEDRNYFIEILQRTVNKFNCKIIEYCVQDNNIYHLIIDVNGGDLSKIMKSINIPYAMHATCEGKLFHDRYKSHPIANQEALEAIRTEIQQAINLGGGFSSFCGTQILPCESVTVSTCKDCISTKEAAFDKINLVANDNQISVGELLKDKPLRNQLIKEIRQTSTLSLKTIGQVFGGISESTVCKILNN
jgi:REP element-mobilizing transposase RayT